LLHEKFDEMNATLQHLTNTPARNGPTSALGSPGLTTTGSTSQLQLATSVVGIAGEQRAWPEVFKEDS